MGIIPFNLQRHFTLWKGKMCVMWKICGQNLVHVIDE